ncbi:MAG TPA: hypothetical protein VIU42_13500 [Xanthobacteraceae bacterium]|jgi:hypothetical protein
MTPANSWVAQRLPLVAALAVALTLGTSASAARKTLSWDDDACTHRISFDPAKHDEKRLNNSIRLLFARHDLAAPIVPFVADPQAAAKLDLHKYDRQCSDVLKTVRELELAPLQGIEDYRRARTGDIDDTCRFGNAEIRGLRDPSALRDYTRAPACSHFIDALEGKSDIDKLFRETVLRQCGNNASPQRCRNETLGEAQKPDGKERVRFYLTMYGWNNCANNNAARIADSKALDKLRAGLERQFRRMFTVRSKCENPG